MPRSARSWSPLALVILASMLPGAASAQEAAPAPEPNPEPWKLAKDIKPLPLVAIPDDPPPHEGAMIDIPYIIEPPDLIAVEVLESLPGRPITGERLVRPDGTFSLGFYGDIAVRGLTVEQVKVKVVRVLQEHLTDDILGLTRIRIEQGQEAPEIIPLPERMPGDQAPVQPGEIKPARPPEEAPPADTAPAGRPSPTRTASARRALRPFQPPHRVRLIGQAPAVPQGEGAKVPPRQDPEIMRDPEERPPVVEAVDPANSLRVFVDITSYNSKVYFVQGDVGVPGRLPFTGKETVLDALNFAGGLVPSGNSKDIHLYRPARGGKPARDYRIDLPAILKGDAVANLQVFPDDRLVVGRKKVAE